MEQDPITGLKYKFVKPSEFNYAYHVAGSLFYKISKAPGNNTFVSFNEVHPSRDKELQDILRKDLGYGIHTKGFNTTNLGAQEIKSLENSKDWNNYYVKSTQDLIDKGFLSKTNYKNHGWSIVYPDTIQTIAPSAPPWVKDKLNILKQASKTKINRNILSMFLERLCEFMMLHEAWTNLRPKTKEVFKDILSEL